MAAPFTDISRLSLNQQTTPRWSMREAIEGCARAGLPGIGLFRPKVAEAGLKTTARLVRDAGLRVSSLCVGGRFPAASAAERKARLDDSFRAVDEAAALQADVLVIVGGSSPDGDLPRAREVVAEGIAALLPYAAGQGVRLGIEPLHPMYAGDRSVVVTLAEANTLVERFGAPNLGIVVDVYHTWWDPALYAQIARARGHIFGFHVNDWLVPTTDLLLCRGMMGDGVIDLRRIRAAVDAAEYSGMIEVEIFNPEIWDAPGDEVLARISERYLAHV
jgi:sugar phosphate isomerase/epimerase